MSHRRYNIFRWPKIKNKN